MILFLASLFILVIPIDSYSNPTKTPLVHIPIKMQPRNDANSPSHNIQQQLMQTLKLTTTILPLLATSVSAIEIPPFPAKGYQTKSGLKYFDFQEGDGVSPRYGELVTFFYTGYFRADPTAKLEAFDGSYLNYGKEPFLHKHGNGRVLRGIDEGLHTMKVGGKRRVIIPKTLGFTEFGMGPLPIDPGRRRRLGKLLDFVEADRGELVYDLELVMVAVDENDQGYYDDVPVTQEEVRSLVLKSLNPELIDKLIKNKPKSF